MLRQITACFLSTFREPGGNLMTLWNTLKLLPEHLKTLTTHFDKILDKGHDGIWKDYVYLKVLGEF